MKQTASSSLNSFHFRCRPTCRRIRQDLDPKQIPTLTSTFPVADGSFLPVVVLGEVSDESHGHAHIDSRPNGDRQHSQEESSPRAGAGQVEISFRHRLVGLRGGGGGGVELKEGEAGER